MYLLDMPTVQENAVQLIACNIRARSADAAARGILARYTSRTMMHIKAVQECALILADTLRKLGMDADAFLEGVKNHDADKLDNLERAVIYAIATDWLYSDKHDNYDIDQSLLDQFEFKAWPEHIRNNPHHVSERYGQKTSEGVRVVPDDPSLNLAIAEMVADWMAMGIEKGNTARWWYEKNSGTKFQFNGENRELIEALLVAEDNAVNQLQDIRLRIFGPVKESTEGVQSKNPITLRKANLNDKQDCEYLDKIDYEARKAGNDPRYKKGEIIERMKSEKAVGWLFVADKTVVGGCICYHETGASLFPKDYQDVIDIDFLALYPEYRAKGYGSLGLTAVFDKIFSKTDLPIVVMSGRHNTGACAFYQKMGMKEIWREEKVNDGIAFGITKEMWSSRKSSTESIHRSVVKTNKVWKESDIRSVDDLKAFYKECEYGLVDFKAGRPWKETHKNTLESDWEENWRLLTTQQLLHWKCGICYDTAIMSAQFLRKWDIEHLFLFMNTARADQGSGYDDDPTHTFVVYKDEDGMWKWLEGSWGPFKSNTWKAKSPKELISWIAKVHANNTHQTVIVRQASGSYPRYGADMMEFYKTMKSYKQILSITPDSKYSNEAESSDDRPGPISDADKKKCGKYLYHGTHRDLDIKSLGIHVCKNRANTDIKAPVVYMNRSLGLACLHCVPFMVGHGSKMSNYREHFVDLKKAINSDKEIVDVEIVHNDPDLKECSGETDGFIYCVKKEDCIDHLYYATPDKPNDWNFVAYRQLPISKKIKIHVKWHKKYDEGFAKQVKSGYMAVEELSAQTASLERFVDRNGLMTAHLRNSPRLTADEFCAAIQPCDVILPYPKILPTFKKQLTQQLSKMLFGISVTSTKCVLNSNTIVGYGVNWTPGPILFDSTDARSWIERIGGALIMRPIKADPQKIVKAQTLMAKFLKESKKHPYDNMKVLNSILDWMFGWNKTADDHTTNSNFCSAIVVKILRGAGIDVGYPKDVHMNHLLPIHLLQCKYLKCVGWYMTEEELGVDEEREMREYPMLTDYATAENLAPSQETYLPFPAGSAYKKIEQRARRHYRDTGANSWQHIQQVFSQTTRACKFVEHRELNLKEYAAVLYHDSSVMTDKDKEGHNFRGAEIAQRELGDLFVEEDLNEIVTAIREHDGTTRWSSITSDMLATGDANPPDPIWLCNKSYAWGIRKGLSHEDRIRNCITSTPKKYGSHGTMVYPYHYLKYFGDKIKVLQKYLDNLTYEVAERDIMNYRKEHNLGPDDIDLPEPSVE